jgi:AMMECR1 domain-containing protein
MKIQINTEAELDIDALADALSNHVQNQIESSIDCALDNYDFRDIVREEVNDMDLSCEIDSAIDDRDDLVGNDEIVEFEKRIEEIETALSAVSSVLPNKALDASLKANEQLTKTYDELVEKCRHFIGVTEPKEDTESSSQI